MEKTELEVLRAACARIDVYVEEEPGDKPGQVLFTIFSGYRGFEVDAVFDDAGQLVSIGAYEA
jgi:hypothetical protein